METKRIRSSIVLLLLWWVSPFAIAGSLITNPVALVSPLVLDFGMVASNAVGTNSLLIENAGGGRLIGVGKVSEPFRIISGERYDLTGGEVQVITLTYNPTGEGGDGAAVTFTGGGGASISVTGRVAVAEPPARKKPKRWWR